MDVNTDDWDDVVKCEDCVTVKLSQLNTNSNNKHKVSDTLTFVHSDLCNLPIPSYNGSG